MKCLSECLLNDVVINLSRRESTTNEFQFHTINFNKTKILFEMFKFAQIKILNKELFKMNAMSFNFLLKSSMAIT